MPQQVKKSIIISIYFALAVSALLVFLQVRNFDFITYDDHVYVYENPFVLNGLSAGSLHWALTTGCFGNWIPVTWFSYMLDRQLFGPTACGFHMTNLLFHIANTLLLFFVLKQMTSDVWPSVFVAAAFALHPMHVQAVAWVAARKDVLSTFFCMLTLRAYGVYVRRQSVLSYKAAIAAFALGLMSKPMLVTLPFVLLLLDYWPLNRIKNFDRQTIYSLVSEKIPFFALSVISGVITLLVQVDSNEANTAEIFYSNNRIVDILLSYTQYIGKMFWPSNLAIFYTSDAVSMPILQAAICALLLLGISLFVIYLGRNQKYLPVGWFWFLGTLIPVIGIFHSSRLQIYADRYTYIPYIGLFIIIAWGIPHLLSKWATAGSLRRKIALGLPMTAVLLTLGICAHREASYWNNSFTLFSHATKVTKNNWLAYNNIGFAYGKAGRFQNAIEAYKQAISIKPDYVKAYNNLGITYGKMWHYQEAIETYKQAIKIKPDFVEAHYNLGTAYLTIGDRNSAMAEYSILKSLNPKLADKLAR